MVQTFCCSSTRPLSAHKDDNLLHGLLDPSVACLNEGENREIE